MAVSPATRALLSRSASLAAYYAGKRTKAQKKATGTVPGANQKTAAQSFNLAAYYGTPGVVPGSQMPAGWQPTVPGKGGGGGGGGGKTAPKSLGLTPAQQAALIAAAGLNPQIDELNRQAAMKEAAGKAAVEAAQRVAAALGELGKGIPEATQAGFNTAGQNISNAAAQLTGEVGKAAQAAAERDNAQLAAMGLPQTISSQAPGALGGLNYISGFLPSQSLFQQAAMAVPAALAQQHAGEFGLLQQGLTTQSQRAQEAADLLSQIGSLEATRPGKVQEALLAIQDQRLKAQQVAIQARAEKAQEDSLKRAWYQTQLQNAKTMTDMTGRLYVVNAKGQVVPAGRAAPGSAAGRAATTAKTAADKLAYQKAQDIIKNAQAQSRIDISQQQADAATARQASYSAYLTWKKKHPNAKATGKNNPGGLSDADVRQYRADAQSRLYTLFYGQKNPNFDPSHGVPGQKGYTADPKNPYYTVKPVSAADAMKLLWGRIPYAILWPIIKGFASLTNSHWADALAWNKPAKGP